VIVKDVHDADPGPGCEGPLGGVDLGRVVGRVHSNDRQDDRGGLFSCAVPMPRRTSITHSFATIATTFGPNEPPPGVSNAPQGNCQRSLVGSPERRILV
jgi:hypothetical protein